MTRRTTSSVIPCSNQSVPRRNLLKTNSPLGPYEAPPRWRAVAQNFTTIRQERTFSATFIANAAISRIPSVHFDSGIQSLKTAALGSSSPLQTLGPGVTWPAGRMALAPLAFFHAPADIIDPWTME